MKVKEQKQELLEKDADGLNELADQLKESLFRLKFRRALGVGDTLADIRREKKTLARVYTRLNELSDKGKKA